MAKVQCPECGKRVDREAGICLECGASLDTIEDVDAQTRSTHMWMNIGLGIMVVTLPFIGLSRVNKGFLLIGILSIAGLVMAIVNKRRLMQTGKKSS